MGKINKVVLLYIVAIISCVVGHSWLDLPASRFPASSSYCIQYDNGSPVTPAICGKDAQGADLKKLRPSTYTQAPCYYPPGNTFNNAPTAVMQVSNRTLCVMWGANAHDTDPTRDLGGGVRLSISSNVVNPTQADFNKMIIANIPYDHFGGVKIELPPLPVGEYVIQFYWDWPTPSQEHLFVSCSNLSILAEGDSRLVSQQSADYGMGLPFGFRVADTNAWRCNAADRVWSNSSLASTTGTTPSTGNTGNTANTGGSNSGTNGNGNDSSASINSVFGVLGLLVSLLIF